MNVLYKTSKIVLLVIIATQTAWARNMPQIPWQGSKQIQIQSKLSQTKLVQHGANSNGNEYKSFLDSEKYLEAAKVAVEKCNKKRLIILFKKLC